MQHIFLAFTNPVAGREAAFNEWYDTRHVPEVLRYGRGFLGCQRYRLHDEDHGGGLGAWKYLALYDLCCDDLLALAERPWMMDSPPLTSFSGLLQDDHVGWVFTPQDRANHERLLGRGRSLPALLLAASGPPLMECAAHVGSPGCHRYVLASAQRSAQQRCPWDALAIYELAGLDGRPSRNGLVSAWRFVPVSRYIVRSEV